MMLSLVLQRTDGDARSIQSQMQPRPRIEPFEPSLVKPGEKKKGECVAEKQATFGASQKRCRLEAVVLIGVQYDSYRNP